MNLEKVQTVFVDLQSSWLSLKVQKCFGTCVGSLCYSKCFNVIIDELSWKHWARYLFKNLEEEKKETFGSLFCS